MATYTVEINNRSHSDGKMCIFQKVPNQEKDIFSLSWFTKQCNRNTTCTLIWDTNYCVSWDKVETLVPGVMFHALESKAVDPFDPGKNAVGLTYSHGDCNFCSTEKTADKGTIGIFTDEKIPDRKVSIGIGMNHRPAFATQAVMNKSFVLTPKVRYYVVFGYYPEGVVMDLSSTYDALEITFPDNVFSRAIIFDEGNLFRYVM